MSETPKKVWVVPVRMYREEMELVKQLQKKFGLKFPQVIRFCVHRMAEREGLKLPEHKPDNV